MLRSGFLVGKSVPKRELTHPGGTNSTICEIQSKTKMWGLLFKRQEKNEFFLSSIVCLSLSLLVTVCKMS